MQHLLNASMQCYKTEVRCDEPSKMSTHRLMCDTSDSGDSSGK